LILLAGILVAVGSYFYYKGKPVSYSVTTQVYLGGGSEEQGLAGSSLKKSTLSAANQTALINSTLITEGVRKQLRTETANPLAQSALKGKVKAKSKEKSQFIGITAEARKAGGAALLANRVAAAYIKRQRASFTRTITKAIAVTKAQIRHIEASDAAASAKTKGAKGGSGGASSAGVIQLAQLNSRVNSLEAELGTAGVQQIGLAKPRSAQLVGSSPKKNAIFGFIIGVILASIAAYVLSRFDRRLRSLADIEAIFHTNILAALSTVRSPVVKEQGRPRPSAALLEGLRRLHTTLEVGNVHPPQGFGGGRSLLFLSADAGDGKSTIIADLAMVQRDAGKRVLILEADFRHPAQSRLLGLTPASGLAEVLSRQVGMAQAMQPVTPVRAGDEAQVDDPAAGVATAVQARTVGSLALLASGARVPNPPALLAAPEMVDTLNSLTGEFDYVLIDAPSPLEVSDVIPLLALASGIVVVARVGHTRMASANRLAELLERTSTTPLLGVVANYVRRAEIARYGFSSAPAARRRRRK
jgi:Mrp family chromosome partitioning ATPase/capsular polysaccharide biosynthesis protein